MRGRREVRVLVVGKRISSESGYYSVFYTDERLEE